MIRGFTFNPLETNCYLIADGGEVAVVDPGCYGPAEAAFLEKAVSEAGRLTHILLTHGHPDHCFGAAGLSRKYGVPVTFSPDDAYILERSSQLAGLFGLDSVDTDFETVPARDGFLVKVGSIELRAIATPGHTPGGICWFSEGEKVLFSGDSLFAGTIGRTDLPGGDYDALIKSVLEKIMTLPEDTMVLPGHGGDTTIGREAATNPFLEPFNEPEGEDVDPIALKG